VVPGGEDPSMSNVFPRAVLDVSELASDGRIDRDATLITFRRLLGRLAVETNETPRSILEDEFKRAPTDEFWRATIGAEG
jgi:hypothetical protein